MGVGQTLTAVEPDGTIVGLVAVLKVELMLSAVATHSLCYNIHNPRGAFLRVKEIDARTAKLKEAMLKS